VTTTSEISELRGEGDIRFSVAVDILQRPFGWNLGMIADVAVDAEDRLWVGARKQHPVSVWTTDGAYLGSWGEPDFQEVHGMSAIDGAIWVVDDQLHVVRRYSPEGEKTLELGRAGWATAAVTHRGQNGGPFNMPTGIDTDASGRIFVSDGYGNRQVHRFSADGTLETSWGAGGIGPGEFGPVHNVTIDGTDRVLISDRENGRMQVFDYDGGFIAEWTELMGPADAAIRDGLVYVVEQGDSINNRMNHQPNGISIYTVAGELLGRWHYERAGNMVGGHGIDVDRHGNVYVADLVGGRVVKLIREG
jgi:DNA-binding beta-propeller fold protein YncE